MKKLNLPETVKQLIVEGKYEEAFQKTKNLENSSGDLINPLYKERKRSGSYYTPPKIASQIAKKVINILIREKKSKYQLRGSDKNKTKNYEINVLEILKSLKICDNSCGTGIFLIALGDELLNQYKKIGLEAFNDNEFKLKRFILLNNLYGVDNSSFAIEIAKLNLWLWLFKPPDDNRIIQNNRNRNKLPNLDFNIKTGNSLIGFFDINELKEGLSLNSDHQSNSYQIINNHLDSLTNLYKKYSHSKNFFDEKQEYLKNIEEKRNILKIYLNEKLGKFFDKNSVHIHQIEKLNAFHWLIEFPDIFFNQKEVGFDAIVGNPPYVRHEEVKHLTDYCGISFKELLYSIYNEIIPTHSSFDLSIYFIIRSIQLIKNGGINSYIITNKWLRTIYGKSIRKFLSENLKILSVTDLTGLKVFNKTISVDTLIYMIKKERPNKNHEFKFSNPTNTDFIDKDQLSIIQSSLSIDGWSFLSKESFLIKEWIDKNGTSISQLGFLLYRGLTTGYNKAFIISKNKKQALSTNIKTNYPLVKPILRGRDIDKFDIDWKDKWIIIFKSGSTKKHIPENLSKKEAVEDWFKHEYFKYYDYFSRINTKNFRGKGLKNRDDKGEYWWELRSCNYYDQFERPKIVMKEIANKNSFAYDNQGFYLLAKVNTIVSPRNLYSNQDLKAITAILNSKLMLYYYNIHGIKLGKGYEFKIHRIRKIPLIIPSLHTKMLSTLTEYCMFLEKNPNSYISNYFRTKIIDNLVYELYFMKKFKQDGLYTKDCYELLNLIIPFVKDIPYEEWTNLYWSNKMKDLKRQEQVDLLNKTKIIETTIQFVYSDLNKYHELDDKIQLILSHPWIKEIENIK